MRRRWSSCVIGALLLTGAARGAEPSDEETKATSGDATAEKAESEESGAEGATEPPAEGLKGRRPERTTKPALDKDTRGATMRAYQRALAQKKLGAAEPLDRQKVGEKLAQAEQKLADGRRDEAIADLVYLVESPRFDPFLELSEGRAAVFLLGDALGRAGARGPARGYLARLVDKGAPTDPYYRRAARSLVELGLDSDRPEVFARDLARAAARAPEELRGDIAYLNARVHERAGRKKSALAELSKVTPRSRFWAQAVYLSGLLEVERGRLQRGEQQFCRVADAKQTPNDAAVFGGSDFFRVRDLARLALGRVAHEQYRFDDSRYYYYLVPSDSDKLPEALYESATGRYEAKDYRAARDLIDQLRALERSHPYEDEVWIFDAYVDLATCEFARADLKLKEFLARYDPVRDAARRLARDRRRLGRLVEAVRRGSDPAGAELGVDARAARALGALLRLDVDYGRTARRLAQLDHQLSGLRRAMGELDDARAKLASPKDVRPRPAAELSGSAADKLRQVEAELGGLRRLVDEARRGKSATEIGALERELQALEKRADSLRRSVRDEGDVEPESGGKSLEDLVGADRRRATRLYARGRALREDLAAKQQRLAKAALVRLDRRLSRLLRRARLGRIETVLGKKRALEVEIEALSQGYLPQGAVDSLDAARYLRDDEEYWPFDGEDWADEYVGGEGLR